MEKKRQIKWDYDEKIRERQGIERYALWGTIPSKIKIKNMKKHAYCVKCEQCGAHCRQVVNYNPNPKFICAECGTPMVITHRYADDLKKKIKTKYDKYTRV